jgi:hypothetical protein
MELSAIFKTLIKSDAEDWHRVSMQTGRELACWRGDVNLRIETSIDDAHVQNDNFFAEWANKNPDQSAKGWFYDLYYNCTLVHRFVLVSVDGARASLPLPRSGTMDVPQLTYRVAEIFDAGGLGEYFPRSGLVVEKNYVEPE